MGEKDFGASISNSSMFKSNNKLMTLGSNRGVSHPEGMTRVTEGDQDVIVPEIQGNSISHNSFNENRFFTTG